MVMLRQTTVFTPFTLIHGAKLLHFHQKIAKRTPNISESGLFLIMSWLFLMIIGIKKSMITAVAATSQARRRKPLLIL